MEIIHKNTKKLKRYSMAIGILILILVDQVTKFIAQIYLGEKVILFKSGFGFKYLEYFKTHFLRLVSYGVVEDGIISIVTLLIIYLIFRLFISECPKNRVFRVAFAFIFGGELGNSIDTLLWRTCGRDFIIFPSLGIEKILGKGNVTNLADIFINIGIALIFIPIIINPKIRKKFWHYKTKNIFSLCKEETLRLITSLGRILKRPK